MTGSGLLASITRKAASLQRFRAGAAVLSIAREARPLPRSQYAPGTPGYDPQLGLFTFRGSYREMGRQFAAAFSLSHILDQSKAYRAAGGEPLRHELTKATALLAQWHPRMLEWLEGTVADDPEHSIDDAMLAAFSSVLTDFPAFSSCSALAFTYEDRPIVGQNLDLGRSCQVALARLLPDDGIAKLARITAGFPWLISIANEAGLVISGSSITVNRAAEPTGAQLPQEMLADTLLTQARSVSEALGLLDRLPPLGPWNGGVSLILADATGDVRHIEVTGSTWRSNEPIDGRWLTTNHFRHADLQALCDCGDWMGARLLENSRARFEHGTRFLASWTGQARQAAVALLRQAGGGGAWLRKARWPDLGYTSASYVIDLHDRTIEYWMGAGTTSSHRVSIDSLLTRPPNRP